MEWPGFEPQTSSIRRGRSIHSTTPHLAFLYAQCLPPLVLIRHFRSNSGSTVIETTWNHDPPWPEIEMQFLLAFCRLISLGALAAQK